MQTARLPGFQKGHKVNSYAQCRIREVIHQRAKEAGLDALNLWIETMLDSEQPMPVRIKCSELVMDRAIGKSVDMVAVANLTGAGDTEPQLLNTQALLALVQARLADDVVAEVPPADALTQGDV
jgi:hypothetical protein